VPRCIPRNPAVVPEISMPMIADRPPVPVGEAARLLGLSRQSTRRLVRRGLLPTVRVPGIRRILFRPDDIERLIESATHQGA
jgi:excisionase family DNA binding protein